MTNKGGRPPFEPTDKHRKKVLQLASGGAPQEDIARVIGISRETLEKYFADELAIAEIEATGEIVGALFRAATIEGNVTAMIFWLKTRGKGKWAEAQPEATSGNQPLPVPIFEGQPKLEKPLK